jgi:hypothetical protein
MNKTPAFQGLPHESVISYRVALSQHMYCVKVCIMFLVLFIVFRVRSVFMAFEKLN